MFGSRENKRKSKKKKKQRESLPSALCFTQPKFVPHLLQDLGLYRFQEEENTKCPQFTLIHQGKNGKKSKRDTGKSKCQSQHEQCTGKAISHQCDIFALWCKILCFSSFYASAPFFLLIMICNVEFDLNSSWLGRFNKFGISSLQKLQN